MSTTLASMNAEVLLAMGNEDPGGLIDAWLNQGQLAIATASRIRELEVAATFTLTGSAAGNDIILQPADFYAPILLINTSVDRVEIKLKPLSTILTQKTDEYLDPAQFAIRGLTFVFRPPPLNSNVIELTYRVRPAPMTSAVDMTLPDEFRPAVVFDAISRGKLINGEEDRSQFFLAQRNAELQKLGDQRGEEILVREDGVAVRMR